MMYLDVQQKSFVTQIFQNDRQFDIEGVLNKVPAVL